MTEIVHIVARSVNGIIGNNGDLPWKLPSDLQHFKSSTIDQICIVGRKTYEGISFLKKREFMVVTRSDINYDVPYGSLDEMIELARSRNKDRIMIIGGGEIYRSTFDIADRLIVTEIQAEIDGDTLYQFDDSKFMLESKSDPITENGYTYTFNEYVKIK